MENWYWHGLVLYSLIERRPCDPFKNHEKTQISTYYLVNLRVTAGRRLKLHEQLHLPENKRINYINILYKLSKYIYIYI